MALSKLADTGERIQMEILKEPVALANVVRSISKDNNPVLHKNAARTFLNLACGPISCKLHILEDGGVAAPTARTAVKSSPSLSCQKCAT